MESKTKPRKKIKTLLVFFFAVSWAVTAFGKPLYSQQLSLLAAGFGFALLWYVLSFVKNKKSYFLLASFWFSAVSAVDLFWMCSTKWTGPLILLVYAGLILALGLEFGLLSLFFYQKKTLGLMKVLAAAGFWAVMEWSRLFFLSGFTFSAVGAALASGKSVQLASITGIYGLSFWVVLVNGCGFLAVVKPKNSCLLLWLVLFSFPYAFGWLHENWQKSRFSREQSLSVMLVQTALSPVQKEPMLNAHQEFIRPEKQWERIVSLIRKKQLQQADRPIDLIVLPEVALPFSAFESFYPLDMVIKILEKQLQIQDKAFFLPLLKEPLARKIEKQELSKEGQSIKKTYWKVSNAFWAQALSNYFKAHMVVGLDDYNDQGQSYNSAFYFSPDKRMIQRYEKQILVPIVEYFPFQWCAKLAAAYDISGVFTPGKEARVFPFKVPLGVSICYEETYGHLMRKNRLKGARMLVNISNDVWFPASALPKKHFELGRIRAVENGVPLVRACNTGVTAAVDAFGNVLNKLEDSRGEVENLFDALFVTLPVHHYPALYSLWGDSLIIGAGFLFLAYYALASRRKKARPAEN